jgi:Site-specific recombinase XerD
VEGKEGYDDGQLECLRKRAGIPHIPMYNIRHVSASAMLANGADLASVAAQLGHSNVNTTGTTYAHVTEGGQQRAVALMPGIKTVEIE